MSNLILMLFILCSPIAKLNFGDIWEWEGDDDLIEITHVEYTDEGEVDYITWESKVPICRTEVKAGNDKNVVEDFDPPILNGTTSRSGQNAISHVEWSSTPTVVTELVDIKLSERVVNKTIPIILIIFGLISIIIGVYILFLEDN